MHDFLDAIVIIIGVAAITLVSMIAGASLQEAHWHRITIERGLAQYCLDTGEWAWIGECE